ncbi:hypothetical protein OROHE_007949 [Orobanche hederae]
MDLFYCFFAARNAALEAKASAKERYFNTVEFIMKMAFSFFKAKGKPLLAYLCVCDLFGLWKKNENLQRLSEQQLYDVIDNNARTFDVMNYITKYGLLHEYQFPWTGILRTFDVPRPPFYVYRASADHNFKATLFDHPTAANFHITKSYRKWCKDSYVGVFQYDTAELDIVYRRMFCDPTLTQAHIDVGHEVALLGCDKEKGIPIYLAHDSWGTSKNWSYKKLACNAFSAILSIVSLKIKY